MRLVYLDESGISKPEAFLSVAGVIVHGDKQHNDVQIRLDELIEKYVPKPDRQGFVFHAKDIYHGSGKWKRDEWSRDKRCDILVELSGIISEFSLPVVIGSYEKEKLSHNFDHSEDDNLRREVMQAMATLDCVLSADLWLAKFFPDENSMIIAEDVDRVKKLTKRAMNICRSQELLDQEGLKDISEKFELPLKRVIDTIHYAAKLDCAHLQLADLCAFCFGRFLNGKNLPDGIMPIIWQHAKWRWPDFRNSQLAST